LSLTERSCSRKNPHGFTFPEEEKWRAWVYNWVILVICGEHSVVTSGEEEEGDFAPSTSAVGSGFDWVDAATEGIPKWVEDLEWAIRVEGILSLHTFSIFIEDSDVSSDFFPSSLVLCDIEVRLKCRAWAPTKANLSFTSYYKWGDCDW